MGLKRTGPLVLALLLALAGCGGGTPARLPLVLGQLLPDAAVTDLHGQTAHLADWRGTPTVVVFWATWCRPCQEEVPLLNATAEEHPEVRLAAVDVNEGAAPVRRFAANHGLRYPVYLDRRVALDIQAIPTTAFVAADGTVRRVVLGPLTPETMQAELTALAGGTA